MAYSATPGHIESNELEEGIIEIIDLLGGATTIRSFWPMQEITGTGITDYAERTGDSLTASASVADWFSHTTRLTSLEFNGTAHYLTRANDTDFDFGDGAGNDTAMTIACLINPDDVTSRHIISKWDETAAAEAREWRLFFDANGYPTMQFYDESGDKYIGRQDQTAFTTDTWQTLIMTYDASETSAGCKIYIDAEQLDDADYEDAGYASMDVVTAPLYVGCKEDAAGAQAEFFDGEMALLGVSATELTAAQVWYLHKRMMGLAGL